MLAAKFDNGRVVKADTCGNKSWFLNGKRHRINGPAVEYSDGDKYWYLNGMYYYEYEYYVELKLRGIK